MPDALIVAYLVVGFCHSAWHHGRNMELAGDHDRRYADPWQLIYALLSLLDLSLWPACDVWWGVLALRGRYDRRLELAAAADRRRVLEDRRLELEVRALEEAGEVPGPR